MNGGERDNDECLYFREDSERATHTCGVLGWICVRKTNIIMEIDDG